MPAHGIISMIPYFNPISIGQDLKKKEKEKGEGKGKESIPAQQKYVQIMTAS